VNGSKIPVHVVEILMWRDIAFPEFLGPIQGVNDFGISDVCQPVHPQFTTKSVDLVECDDVWTSSRILDILNLVFDSLDRCVEWERSLNVPREYFHASLFRTPTISIDLSKTGLTLIR
jgi:hypothetical protein